MRRLKNRKGIFVVLFGLLFMVLMSAAAMAIDMSRIWSMRNELQTAADGGALAGAVQLTPPHNKTYTVDTATVMARLNRSLYDLVSVDSVQTGQWNDNTQTFTLTDAAVANAVHVVVSHGTNKLIMGALGIAAPRVKARATAWANAPVNNANCMKPWSMPYVVMMDIVNRRRVADGTLTGDPDSYDNLTRDFTDDDRQLLATMDEASRTFTLKLASGPVDNPVPGSTLPGNYQAVRLPRKQSADGTMYPDGQPGNGASDYVDVIQGPVCYTLGVGDVLETKTGNMPTPTVSAVEKENAGDQYYVCNSIDRTAGANYGNCMNDQGGVGVDIKTAFHLCYTGCSGQSDVTVRLIGAFTLKKIYPDNGNANQGETWSKGQIVGVFKPLASSGPVGPGPTTLQRIILVR
jgi:Flp pilus assembly protein TadG